MLILHAFRRRLEIHNFKIIVQIQVWKIGLSLSCFFLPSNTTLLCSLFVRCFVACKPFYAPCVASRSFFLLKLMWFVFLACINLKVFAWISIEASYNVFFASHRQMHDFLFFIWTFDGSVNGFVYIGYKKNTVYTSDERAGLHLIRNTISHITITDK